MEKIKIKKHNAYKNNYINSSCNNQEQINNVDKIFNINKLENNSVEAKVIKPNSNIKKIILEDILMKRYIQSQ